jgi:hypothetical protein
MITKARAVMHVMVVMLMVQTGLTWAQAPDNTRIQQLEDELHQMRRDLDALKQERQEPMGVRLGKIPIDFGASITIRYDVTDVEDTRDLRLDEARNGFRTRDRFWATFAPDGPVQAGFRLGTGQNPSPTSPFVRFGDLFRTKSFDLDQFYLTIRPIKLFDKRSIKELPVDFLLQAGKVPQPFWRGDIGTWHSELIWDDDVSPEGVLFKIAVPNLRPISVELTGGYFVIEEVDNFRFSGLTGDTYLAAGQLKVAAGPAAVAFAFYDFERLNAGLRAPSFDPTGAFLLPGQSAILLRTDGLQRSNNQISIGPGANGFVEDSFQIINVTGQVHLPLPFMPSVAPEIFFVGDYANNLSVDNDNQGYGLTLGLRGGAQSGSALRPFTLWFTYRDVDNDATLATFADSDLGLGTGYRGFEAGANYQIHRNLLLQISGFSFKNFPDKSNYWSRIFFDVVATF